jgi:hypothetical protein
MIAVFLSNRMLVTRKVTHTHVAEVDDDDTILYSTLFFFLDRGMAVLATSAWAEEHIGQFVGVLDDGEDPEMLRAEADRLLLEQCDCGGLQS